MRTNSRSLGLLVLAVALALGVSACTGNTPLGDNTQPTPEPPKITIVTPADGATDVSTAVELELAVPDGTITGVWLQPDQGSTIAATQRPDGTTWLPDQQLVYGAHYTLTVTAAKPDGTTGQVTSDFTTMAQPTQTVSVRSHWIADGDVVGVGMPIILYFDSVAVPSAFREQIERRLFVTSTPAQEGSWHWFDSDYPGEDHTVGLQVQYRPKEYWQPGTKIHVRAALGGTSWGYQYVYGANDLTLDFTIGDANIIEVDNTTKKMTFTHNGVVVQTYNVSLGKDSTPSSSGHMLAFTREHPRVFDTTDRGYDEYHTVVQYAEEITFSGEFIHDAPWSVGQVCSQAAGGALNPSDGKYWCGQGFTNVSHGCLNVSPDAGKWIYDNVHWRGDPVIVTGTSHPVVWGDGLTAWDVSWEAWLEGSALPH